MLLEYEGREIVNVKEKGISEQQGAISETLAMMIRK